MKPISWILLIVLTQVELGKMLNPCGEPTILSEMCQDTENANACKEIYSTKNICIATTEYTYDSKLAYACIDISSGATGLVRDSAEDGEDNQGYCKTYIADSECMDPTSFKAKILTNTIGYTSVTDRTCKDFVSGTECRDTDGSMKIMGATDYRDGVWGSCQLLLPNECRHTTSGNVMTLSLPLSRNPSTGLCQFFDTILV